MTVVITNFPLTAWCPQSAPKKCNKVEFRIVVTPDTFKVSRPMYGRRPKPPGNCERHRAKSLPFRGNLQDKSRRRISRAVRAIGVGSPAELPAEWADVRAKQRPCIRRRVRS